MDKFITERIDSDLKVLSYQCDEFISKKPGVSEYYTFCKNYYYFLKVLNSINWKDPEIKKTINEFPVLEIPPLGFSSIIIFVVFVITGIFIHSVFFFLFFIILPLSFIAILVQQSILKNSKKNLIRIIHVSAELRRKLFS